MCPLFESKPSHNLWAAEYTLARPVVLVEMNVSKLRNDVESDVLLFGGKKRVCATDLLTIKA